MFFSVPLLHTSGAGGRKVVRDSYTWSCYFFQPMPMVLVETLTYSHLICSAELLVLWLSFEWSTWLAAETFGAPNFAKFTSLAGVATIFEFLLLPKEITEECLYFQTGALFNSQENACDENSR